MYETVSIDRVHIAQEIDKLCQSFLNPRGFSYFQFKRIYKDGSIIILANRSDFFHDFLERDLIGLSPSIPLYMRQSSLHFWDECFSEDCLTFLKEKRGVYHVLTIISRRKNFYDCTSFAMAARHPSPYAYYFHILKELQKFAELFPSMARNQIEKCVQKLQTNHTLNPGANRKGFFLPTRSTRFRIGEGSKEYITTYEALCVQLLQEGKSYKEIGAILSMAPSTVETHLKRLKLRTGLTLQELSLQFFHAHNNGKRVFNLEQAIDLHQILPHEAKNKKK